MCADIVKFPGKPPRDVESPVPHDGPAALRFAFEIHEIIVLGIAAGDFDGDKSAARVGVLCDKLHCRYGPECSAVAEGFFEYIYGCDPYTFLEHVTSYRG
ncbi:MAG: hypothetical protein H6905_06875 [Hyphomicrobiales bacterium]|nr:hypothetical protein [Hyphomicrobiales bacterium]